MQALLKLMEYFWPPDAWLLAGIRRLNRRKLAELEGASPEALASPGGQPDLDSGLVSGLLVGRGVERP